jgi:hypothetical protein
MEGNCRAVTEVKDRGGHLASREIIHSSTKSGREKKRGKTRVSGYRMSVHF